jgi:hypothetical protein
MAKRLEEAEQIRVIQWRDANKHTFPGLKRLFHVPNGGLRSGRTAITMSRLGTTKGVPDLILLTPSPGEIVMPAMERTDTSPIGFQVLQGHFHFFCGEMKAPGGKLSKEQLEFKAQVIDDGGYYCTAEKAMHMVAAIRMYLLIGT